MHTTTLGEALKGVGIDPKKDQVRNLAADALRKFKTATKARERFISVIKQKRLTDTALEILLPNGLRDGMRSRRGLEMSH